MEWANNAAVLITAITALITAVGGAFLAVKVIMPTHKIVNQQRTDMMRFITVLKGTLKEHDIDIPLDQSTLD